MTGERGRQTRGSLARAVVAAVQHQRVVRAERLGQVDDWFSFVTLSPDPGDSWARTVLVNVVHDGCLRLVHVPDQGKQEWIFQAEAAKDSSGLPKFLSRQWVRIGVAIEDENAG